MITYCNIERAQINFKDNIEAQTDIGLNEIMKYLNFFNYHIKVIFCYAPTYHLASK